MRGEYGVRLADLGSHSGSSPHAWGIPVEHCSLLLPCRFIPTCVGNTTTRAATTPTVAVHPHMRGEYGPKVNRIGLPSGSSPHAWGIPGHEVNHSQLSRFIPTCVGNTIDDTPVWLSDPVHPHMRGEYSKGTDADVCGRGSSPHAWGIHNAACPPIRLAPVHPHMRGEYDEESGVDYFRRGSSPHAWGIQAEITIQRHGARFIPTCVGNTAARRCGSPRRAVHPHMRGEYDDGGPGGCRENGSSPHAWGIRRPRRRDTGVRRFIPTCVGNTALRHSAWKATSVHPHMRGEYPLGRQTRMILLGSSPHAWGIRNTWTGRWMCSRFIPTCVGNTSSTWWPCCMTAVHPHMRGEYLLGDDVRHHQHGSSPHAWGIPLNRR